MLHGYTSSLRPPGLYCGRCTDFESAACAPSTASRSQLLVLTPLSGLNTEAF
jgi:hypothetical protein